MMGININCKDFPFVDAILVGAKTVETRNCHSLRPYVGQRVGLIETGTGTARLRGYATIIREVVYDTEEGFYRDHSKHLIYPADKRTEKYRWAGRAKYGYVLKDVVETKATAVTTRGHRSPENFLKRRDLAC